MQTPNTPRGRETERLMLLWRKQNPDADASAYNREWDSVYRKLEGTFSDAEIVQLASMRLDALDMGVSERRYMVQDTTDPGGFAADVAPPKQQQPRDPRLKHAAQTKGAFGKPKHLRKR